MSPLNDMAQISNQQELIIKTFAQPEKKWVPRTPNPDAQVALQKL